MEHNQFERLESISKIVRKAVVDTSHKCKIPHLGSCLSCLDLLVNLYWREMKCFPSDPENSARDVFVLSKGHASPALLHILAYRGYFGLDRLAEFGQDGSYFHEHPPMPGLIPGVEAATGSLGHGLPIATGIALANRISSNAKRIFCIVGDGECNEGVIWEAAMFASAARLSNLTVIVDYNKWQATSRTVETLGSIPLSKKWQSFGWNVENINGHSQQEISKSLDASRANTGPNAIIANTVKGKGISFMEDDNNWHYKTPNPEEYIKALDELVGS